MGDAQTVLEVDLVGTQLLLDAFEPLVEPGSAAVCFASSAAYQVAPFVDADKEMLLRDPLAPDFLDRATELVRTIPVCVQVREGRSDSPPSVERRCDGDLRRRCRSFRRV